MEDDSKYIKGLEEYIPPDEDFEVFHHNWRAVLLFQDLMNQFDFGPDGTPFGIPKSEIVSLFRLIRLPKKQWPLMHRRLQFIEHGALKAVNTPS